MTSAPTLAPVADPVQPRVAPPPYRMRRVLVVVLLVLAVLIPYGVTLALLWSDLSTRLTVAERERDGITYLAPLVRLLSATADVQSVTVAGARPDTTEIRAAIGAVDVMDNRLGAELGTQERWADVSNRLDALLQAPPSGQAAYTSFTQVVDLETGLITAVGDSSDLILDPQLDSFYVIDAALVRVPAILVSAGRANDLVRLGPPAALAPGIAVAADDVRTRERRDRHRVPEELRGDPDRGARPRPGVRTGPAGRRGDGTGAADRRGRHRRGPQRAGTGRPGAGA